MKYYTSKAINCSIVYTSKPKKTTEVSISKRLVKYTVAHHKMGFYEAFRKMRKFLMCKYDMISSSRKKQGADQCMQHATIYI